MGRAHSTVLLICGLAVSAFDVQATGVTLVSSANPAVFGAAITLTATVNPPSATGKVTFYDGVTVLGTAALSGGKGALPVELNVTGNRSLVARYLGDGLNAPAASSPVPLTVTSVPASGFVTSNIVMGIAVGDAAAADFNNDGKPDIVAVGPANFVEVALGNGDGTFGAPIPSFPSLGSGSFGLVAIGDFNQDANQDIAFSNLLENKVVVFFGNGDGTFSGATVLPTAAGQIIVADFNADGFPDLAVLHAQPSGAATGVNTAGILLGAGNGTFGPPTEYLLAPHLYNGVYNMIAGDVNNDGSVDLLTVVSPDGGDDREILVLLGNGAGGFAAPISGLSFDFIYNYGDSYALQDMNGDGRPDLVFAPGYGYQVGILPGHGDGTFGEPAFFAIASSQPQYVGESGGVSVADFDGDGILDVLAEYSGAINSQSAHFLDLYAGNGDGTVQSIGVSSASLYAANSFGTRTSLILADFNRDGRIDIANVVSTDTGAIEILSGAALPLPQVSVTHTGYFTPGQAGATFTLSVNNVRGLAATSGPVTVSGAAGADLAFVSLGGSGWTCSSTTCSRSDPLSPGASYPPLIQTVNVDIDLSFPQVNVIAMVSGGGASVVDGNMDNASVQATEPPPVPTSPFPANGSTGVSLPLYNLGWNSSTGPNGATSYDVYFGTSPTPPFVANVSWRFTGFAPGTLSLNTTYYWRIVGKNSWGDTSSATWSFTITTGIPCNPTLSSSSAVSTPPGGIFSTGVTDGDGCAWTATSSAAWISVTSGTSGSGNGVVTFSVAANTGSAREGNLTVAGLTFSVSQNGAVVAPMGVSPGAGNGTTQTFTFSFVDPAGYGDLGVLDILINNYLDGIGACYFALVPASSSAGYLYLVDDAGDGGYVAGTPMLLPSSASLMNSQCSINGSGSSISASGNTLTVTLHITFASGFAGNKILYMAARSTTQNSGWQALGTWEVPGASIVGPGVGSVTPGHSVSTGQTYSFTFTDTSGYADLAVLDVLTNSFLDGISACYLAYVPTGASNGYLYLVDDAGDGGYSAGSPILLSSGGTLQNSQCTIDTSESSASASGSTLTLNLAIGFSPSFAGNQVFYLASRNSATGNSGWQAAGSVTVP
ncbi:MAG TPA: FG-GAP-like repeat-containing protein [Bryobacteraceae bacterium]|jgi:hypothetical protein